MKTAISLVRILFGAALFAMTTLPAAVPASYNNPSEAAPLADADCLPKYPPPPVVKIMVRVPACAEAGTAIKYCICIENCSNAEAHHVVVKDALPDNAKFVKSDPAPVKPGPELQWSLGTIGAGARREIFLWLQPTNTDDVKNCARVQFEHGQCVVTRQAGLAPGGRPMVGPVPTTEFALFDLEVKGPKENYANLPTKYEIIVTNKGKGRALNTQIVAALPHKLKVEKASSGGIIEPGEDQRKLVVWKIGTLEPGAARVVELTVKATDKGEFCFKVGVDADGGIKKDVEVCTKFTGVSAMTLEMFDRDDPVFIGHKTSYPITIRNQGSEPVTNVRVRAFIPDALRLDKTSPQFDKQEDAKGGTMVEFKMLPQIEVGHQVRYEVFVEAVRAGVTVFWIDVTADQLEPGRPVIEQESTTVVDDRPR